MEHTRVTSRGRGAGPYVVACPPSGRGGGGVALTAPSCEQAWEALRIHLRARLDAPDRPRVGVGEALDALEREGPSPLGWWTEVHGEEFWYGPGALGSHGAGLSSGERALLDAVVSPPVWPARAQ